MYEFADADVRLAGSALVVDIKDGSAVANEGRLEVKVADIWGTVCDYKFDDGDAGVACYMLGFGYVRNVKKHFGLFQRAEFDFRHYLVFAEM